MIIQFCVYYHKKSTVLARGIVYLYTVCTRVSVHTVYILQNDYFAYD